MATTDAFAWAAGKGAAAVLLTLAFVGCSAGPKPEDRLPGGPVLTASRREPRDVVLITVDTLRADAVGFSGSGKVETPSLDRLAQRGVILDQTRAHAVLTLPSHASILTGLYPYRHGVRDNAGFFLDPTTPTLAGELRKAGWATGAFVSAFPLDRRFGLDAGFDFYDDAYEGHGRVEFTPPERPAGETVARALAWWDAQRGKHRFLWVHLFTPHFPYEPPEPFASRYRAAPYYGEAATADDALRPLVDRVLEGADRGAVVVFTSDHGEALGEHGERTHGLFAYDGTLKVPCVLTAEGLVAAGRTSAAVFHVDLMPTILELVGLPAPAGLSGRSLLGDAGDGEDAGYFEALAPYLNRGWAPLTGVVHAGMKAIRLPVPELYDLRADPAEADNLAERRPRELDARLARLPDVMSGMQRESVDPEVAARLRSLGYVSGSPSRPTTFDASLDPKNLVDVDRSFDDAVTLWQRHEYESAVAAVRSTLSRHPRMLAAYTQLATFLADLGRLDDAIRTLQQAVSLGIADENAHRKLALLLVRVNRAREARAVLEPYGDSRDPDTQGAIGRAAAAAGDWAEARERFDRELRLDPGHPGGRADLGILLLQTGKVDEARRELERAVEADPFLSDAWNALGVIRLRGGDPASAALAWERAVEADPRNPDALSNLSVARERLGDYRGAADALARFLPLAPPAEREQAASRLERLRRGPPAR